MCLCLKSLFALRRSFGKYHEASNTRRLGPIRLALMASASHLTDTKALVWRAIGSIRAHQTRLTVRRTTDMPRKVLAHFSACRFNWKSRGVSMLGFMKSNPKLHVLGALTGKLGFRHALQITSGPHHYKHQLGFRHNPGYLCAPKFYAGIRPTQSWCVNQTITSSLQENVSIQERQIKDKRVCRPRCSKSAQSYCSLMNPFTVIKESAVRVCLFLGSFESFFFQHDIQTLQLSLRHCTHLICQFRLRLNRWSTCWYQQRYRNHLYDGQQRRGTMLVRVGSLRNLSLKHHVSTEVGIACVVFIDWIGTSKG